MIFKVENLGSLQHAEVDLDKDLIIFCGGNNTGKTYLTNAVYGLCKLEHHFILKSLGNILMPQLIELANNSNKIATIDFSFFFEKDNSGNYLVKTNHIETYKSDLHLFFGLKKEYFANTKVSFETKNHKQLIDNPKSIATIFDNIIIDWIPNSFKANIQFKIFFSDNSLQKKIELILRSISLNIYIYWNSFLNIPFPQNTHIFTSERSATNLFGKELYLSRNQISFNATANTNSAAQKRYSLPIENSLRVANDLAFLSKNISKYEYLAEELEQLIGGKINISEYGEMRFTSSQNQPLELHGASSTVKSLSGLIFYFRHQAQENDFIIIDEPELNLHPDNQRKVARFLARVVNEGFKVMMSTHSDYIIREINNLILLHSQKNTPTGEALIQKYKYNPNQTLDFNRVGAYIFNTTQNSAIPIDETGFAVDSIDKEINELGDASTEIYYNFYNLKK